MITLPTKSADGAILTSVTQSVQQVQMSPNLLINGYFDIIEYHKGDKIQQYDTISMYTVYVEPLQRIMAG